MIHLLYPNYEKLFKLNIRRLMRNNVYKDTNGKDLKKVDLKRVEKQLKTDNFKQMQGHKVVILLEKMIT